MSRTPRDLTTSLMAIALLVGACTPATQAPSSVTPSVGGSIAGTYNCTGETDPQSPTEVWELIDDGTVTRASGETGEAFPAGTWSVEGDSGMVTFEGEEDAFTIEGDRLVFGGPEGWACTPA